MKKRNFKRSLALLIGPLGILFLLLFWLGRQDTANLKNPEGRKSASSVSSDQASAEVASGPSLLSLEEAVNLTPVTPLHEAFAHFGSPSPVRPYPRGPNAERRYAEPMTSELPDAARTSAPLPLALSPDDGRITLLPEEVDLHTKSARRMVLDVTALEAVVEGKSARLLAPLPDGSALTLVIDSVKNRGGMTYTLEGEVEGEPQTSVVQLVLHDGILHGTVARYHLDQHVEYRILPSGHLIVRELDTSTMTDQCGDPGTESGGAGTESSGIEGEEVQDTIGYITIDVVVGYDKGAREADGGYAQMEARIIASVDRMTTAFANSEVTATELMLLGTVEDPDYEFPGQIAGSMGSTDELGNLNNTSASNPALNTVSDYADALGADLKAFIVKQADGSAGVAYRPGTSSITSRDYMTTTRITFGHELGHNIGARHSWGDTSGSDAETNVHAFCWRLAPPDHPRVRTIMAYDWNWGTRIPYFANPDVLYQGVRTGQANGYDATGDPHSDPRYVSGGYVGGLGAGFNGSNPSLGARNAHFLLAEAPGRANLKVRTDFAVVAPATAAIWDAGSTNEIYWTGGDHIDAVQIDLYKGGVFHSQITSGLSGDQRRFPWAIPPEMVTGTDYMIRVTRNGALTADSGLFTIFNQTLKVVPVAGLDASGDQGGPFTPSQQIYAINNAGETAANWTASANQPWVGLSASSGTVASGNSENVTIFFTSAAEALPSGIHDAVVTFVLEDTQHQRTVSLQLTGEFPKLSVQYPAGTSLQSGVSSVSIGSATLGGEPSSRLFTLLNIIPGTELELSSASITGTNAADFTVSTTGMSTSVEGGGSTALTVHFLPTATGVRAALLNIASNDPETPVFTVSLTGTGSATPGPEQQIFHTAVLPRRVSDGPVSLGAFTTSGLPLTFEVLAGPVTVDANGIVTPTGTDGAVTIRIRQAGNGDYSSAEDVYVTFVLGTWHHFTKVATGWATYALRADGTLWTWGYVNGTGSLADSTSPGRVAPQQIGSASNWTDFDNGNNFGLGLRSNGTMWAWGINSSNQLGDGTTTTRTSPVQIGAGQSWAAVAAGNSHGAAVTTGGTLWTWGLNTNGQLGHGDTTQRSTPTQVGSASDWTRVACHGNFTIALKANGELWTWGLNSSGQLGHGDTTQRTSPTRVGTDNDWAKISSGTSHTLALKTNGTLWAWGAGASGRLGHGTTSSSSSPVQVGTATDWTDIAGGSSTSAARKKDGSVWIWGGNTSGQLGDGSTANKNTPQRFAPGNDWAGIETGVHHSAAWREDGMVWVAGHGRGFSGASPRGLVPGSATAHSWLQLSGTGSYFHLLRADGTLWGWGGNNGGPIGDGISADKRTLTQIGNENQWQHIASGSQSILTNHSLAVKNSGTLWSAGANGSAQLGHGDTTQRTTFTQVGTATNWKQAACGSSHSMAVRTNGTLWGWGLNSAYHLGLGDTTQRTTPEQVGSATDWEIVACGGSFSVGIKTDGTLWAWGANASGQLGLGDTTQRTTPEQVGSDTDWVAVACGLTHTLALKSDGTLWAWGLNSNGQLGLGNTTNRTSPNQVGTSTNWTRIAASRHSSAALTSAGTVWTTGENRNGQLGDGSTTNQLTFTQAGTAGGFQLLAIGSQSLTAVQSDNRIWTAGTSGAQVLAGGREFTRVLPVQPELVPQSINPPAASHTLATDGIRLTSSSGLPVILRVVSGPATAVGDTLQFNAAGNVVLQAWQPGDERTWNAAPPEQFTLTITGPTPAELFTIAMTAAGLSGDDAAPGATPFDDGVANLLKYAFNMNLGGPDARIMPSAGGTNGLPLIAFQSTGAGTGVLHFRFLRRVNSGLVYTPKKSPSLEANSWESLTVSPSATPIDEDWESIHYAEPVYFLSTPRCFGVVEVSLP